MTKDEFIERYCGEYPDERFRKGRRTWDEIRESMYKDLEAMELAQLEQAKKENETLKIFRMGH